MDISNQIQDEYTIIIHKTRKMQTISFLEMMFNFIFLLYLKKYIFFLPFICSYIGWNGFLYYRDSKILLYIIGHLTEIVYECHNYSTNDYTDQLLLRFVTVILYNLYIIINSMDIRDHVVNIHKLIINYASQL